MQFSFHENELNSLGTYPTAGTNYGDPFYPIDKLDTPITPRENMRRFFEHQPLCWAPDPEKDYNVLYSDCIPDCYACKYEGGIDSFGVRWIPVPNNPALPAFVDPDCRMIQEISQWRSLPWPDVDSWDWAKEKELYQDLDPDRMRQGIIVTGFFERMIDVMGFEDAAVALIEDPKETGIFLDALLEYNKKVMRHYKEDLACDVIMLHDDWAAQRAPFFSLDTAMTLLVPRIRELTAYCHSLGMYFIFHSCGNGYLLREAYVATGADAWQIQLDAIEDHLNEIIADYGDRILLDAYVTIEESDEERVKAYIDQLYEKYCSTGRIALSFYDMLADTRSTDFRKYCYEASRKCVNR